MEVICPNCDYHIKKQSKPRKPRLFKHPTEDGMKKCTGCGETKEENKYDKNMRGVIMSQCKVCRKKKNAEYYKKKKSTVITDVA